MLWELCAGRRLFARDSDAATLGAVLGEATVSPPSAWNDEVPPELDHAILAALERDLARRTASAEELAHALAGVLLRITRSPEDVDLRALMHRLWPEGPAPAAAPERTRVRPVAVAAEPIAGATRVSAPATAALEAEASARAGSEEESATRASAPAASAPRATRDRRGDRGRARGRARRGSGRDEGEGERGPDLDLDLDRISVGRSSRA